MGQTKGRTLRPLKDRLMGKVSIDPNTNCWNWTGTVNGAGYGTIGLGTKEQGKGFVHRVSWTLFRGEIPQGMVICHKCDNKLCCNPDHLFPETQLANMQDMISKGRACAGAKWHRATRHLAKGESHGRRILSESQVVEILQRFHRGETNRTRLAEAYGVTRKTVSNIVNGKNWTHVVV